MPTELPLPENPVVLVERPRGPGGRPTKYDPQYARIAEVMCRGGATDVELAEAFDVTVQTLYNWRARHPEFLEATRASKEAFDERIERSFAQRAAGYDYTAEKILVVGGRIYRVQITEHVPADVRAAYLWLRNRRPDEWRHGMSGGGAQVLPPPDELPDAEALELETGELLDMSEERLDAMLREEFPELTRPGPGKRKRGR